jgi:hypothetical protein
MTKTVKAAGDNVSFIQAEVLGALNSSPEIKACIKPGDLGLKAGEGTYIVIMTDGSQYRMSLKVSQAQTNGVE